MISCLSLTSIFEPWKHEEKKINFPFMINYCKNVHHLWQFLINGYFLVLCVFLSRKKKKNLHFCMISRGRYLDFLGTHCSQKLLCLFLRQPYGSNRAVQILKRNVILALHLQYIVVFGNYVRMCVRILVMLYKFTVHIT